MPLVHNAFFDYGDFDGRLKTISIVDKTAILTAIKPTENRFKNGRATVVKTAVKLVAKMTVKLAVEKIA